MVIKINNKQEKFYKYMGKMFGSRILERETNDRLYDDNNKEWYIYLENDTVKAFASLSNNVIKNIYTTKEIYLEKVLTRIIQENTTIKKSIVTNKYIKIYKNCEFTVDENINYKNFVKIYYTDTDMERIEA